MHALRSKPAEPLVSYLGIGISLPISLFNILTLFALYLEKIFVARIIFGSCCLSMMISIVFFIREIQISTKALKLHMSDMDVDVN